MLLETPICDFGWQAPDFTLNDAHGSPHALADYLGDNALLIAFICNHCPYVQRIAHDFSKTTSALAKQGVQTLAIMSNDYHDYPADAPPRMVEFATQSNFEFPYLVDEGQHVGRAYGAVCTPDFFGFNKDGGLQYRGNFQGPNGEPTLFDAMVQISKTGKGPRAQTPSMGCSIKWTN